MSVSKKTGSTELVGVVPELYSIFKGQVVSIQPYGVFIKIPCCSKNGLVHRSQISNTAIDKLEEVVELGEKVYCKVISAEPDGNKIALSMKVVNQTTGQDLDPALVQTSQDEKQKRSFFKRGSQPIELGAVFATTCKKCGGQGHLAQGCFHRPGDQKYDLLDDESDQQVENETPLDSNPKRHKKGKKQKKKKKNKHEKSGKKDKKSHVIETAVDRKTSSSFNPSLDLDSPNAHHLSRDTRHSEQRLSRGHEHHSQSDQKRSRSSSLSRKTKRRRSRSSSESIS